MNKRRFDLFGAVNGTWLVLIALLCVYPFLYVFFVSATNGTYLALGEMSFWPIGFNLKAYGYILSNRASTWGRGC
jgi:putative aldouronate transport system permease protein